MIAVIETVLAEWNTKHPDLKVHVSDISKINGGNFYPPHHSHQLGVDVDLSTSSCPSFTMSDTGCYDKKYAIELAKLLFDTKAIKYIFYNDSSVNSEVNSYARANKLPGRMQPESGHEDHFHVRIKDGLYTKACSL
jgi:murein endopeptidase